MREAPLFPATHFVTRVLADVEMGGISEFVNGLLSSRRPLPNAPHTQRPSGAARGRGATAHAAAELEALSGGAIRDEAQRGEQVIGGFALGK
jgi:hypothetical protein